MKKILCACTVALVVALLLPGCGKISTPEDVMFSEKTGTASQETWAGLSAPMQGNGIVLDGILTPGEWNPFFLGTSETGFGGGMAVDVYGFADATHLWVAYDADTSQPGWATTCAPPYYNSDFRFTTPHDAEFPEEGLTRFNMEFDEVLQSDGSDWVVLGTLTEAGVEYYYELVTDGSCHDVAEFKIPLDLITYAGADCLVTLSGQYWQSDQTQPDGTFLVSLCQGDEDEDGDQPDSPNKVRKSG